MSFKEILEKDITSVFFNLEEFGEEHNIDERDVICIKDEDLFATKQLKRREETEGIFINGFTLFINNSFFKVKPHSGETLSFDKVTYEILSVSQAMGVLELDLKRFDEI